MTDCMGSLYVYVCVYRCSPWEVCDGENSVDVRDVKRHLSGDVSPGVGRGVTVH